MRLVQGAVRHRKTGQEQKERAVHVRESVARVRKGLSENVDNQEGPAVSKREADSIKLDDLSLQRVEVKGRRRIETLF